MTFGTLAGSHLTFASRCADQGMLTPQGVHLADVASQDAKLQKAANLGLECIVLKEEAPYELQADISAWRIQDQNSNMSYHEFDLLQTILEVAESLSLIHI